MSRNFSIQTIYSYSKKLTIKKIIFLTVLQIWANKLSYKWLTSLDNKYPQPHCCWQLLTAFENSSYKNYIHKNKKKSSYKNYNHKNIFYDSFYILKTFSVKFFGRINLNFHTKYQLSSSKKWMRWRLVTKTILHLYLTSKANNGQLQTTAYKCLYFPLLQ